VGTGEFQAERVDSEGRWSLDLFERERDAMSADRLKTAPVDDTMGFLPLWVNAVCRQPMFARGLLANQLIGERHMSGQSACPIADFEVPFA